MEHAVKSLQEVRPILDDLRHRQLLQICGDIDQVREGVDELKPEFCQGFDDVYLRVGNILTKMGTPVLSRQEIPLSGLGTAGCSQPTRATPLLTRSPQFPPVTAPQPCFRVDPGPTTFPPVSHPYYGERDMRNFDAQRDPRRYTPPRPQLAGRSGLSVDATTDDTHAHRLGGPIISPRQWDRARVAQAAGVSSLDVAALGCQEYHGYDNGYCPLT